MKHLAVFAFLAALLNFFSSSLSASPNIDKYIEHINDVEFYLMTIDKGETPYTLAGHSVLRVKNSSGGSDFVFNWGIFDSSDPAFLTDFIQGKMRYRVGIWPFRLAFQNYVRREKRTIWQEKINLNSSQKLIVLNRLKWWMLPSHARYDYSIQHNNCSTIIRDMIDEALDGEIKKSTVRLKNSRTYRDQIDEYFPYFPWADFAFELIANSDLDTAMSEWDFMYLPFNLQRGLKAKTFADGHSLLGQTQTLSTGTVLNRPKISVWSWLLIGLAVFLVISFALFKKSKSTFIRLTGMLTILGGGISFVLSALMIFLWVSTTHMFTHHNANLLFFWIFDFYYLWLGLKIFRSSQKSLLSERDIKLAKRYGLAHILSLLVLFVGSISGVVSQDVSFVLFYLMPWSVFILGHQFLSFKNFTSEEISS
jgi:hypothetical protein